MKNRVLAIIIPTIVVVLDFIFFTSDAKMFSENENRYLTLFPKFSTSSVSSGKYMDNLTDYVRDQFPYRDSFVGIKTSLDKAMLKTEINNVYLCKDNYLIDKYTKIKDKEKLIRRFNEFNDKVDIDLYLALAPTSISVNSDKLPPFSVYDNQSEDINYIYDKVAFTTISMYDKLNLNNTESDMFYHLDHHWTSDGAYVAYQEIIKNMGLNYVDKSQFEINVVSDSFYGTLYSKTSDYSKSPDSIKVYSYDNNLEVYYADKDSYTNSLYDYSYLSTKDKYSLFLSNNHSLIVINNYDADTEDELIVIKDSYANSLIPFLVNHYKKVHVIDPRYYHKSISEYIKDNKEITTGLILYNINTIESDLGVYTIR